MALITCPECKKDVSDLAPACPSCGCPVRSAPSPSLPHVVTHVRHEEVNRGFSKGIDKGMEQFGTGVMKFILSAIAVGIFVAGIAIWSLMRCPDCSGSGKTWGGLVSCSKCQGSGWRK